MKLTTSIVFSIILSIEFISIIFPSIMIFSGISIVYGIKMDSFRKDILLEFNARTITIKSSDLIILN